MHDVILVWPCSRNIVALEQLCTRLTCYTPGTWGKKRQHVALKCCENLTKPFRLVSGVGERGGGQNLLVVCKYFYFSFYDEKEGNHQ